eukprot:m.28879 g.28879  ORF g.28879 m.28879 type:complete len:1017 (+) comp16000_c0_seq1:593-3643(+)
MFAVARASRAVQKSGQFVKRMTVVFKTRPVQVRFKSRNPMSGNQMRFKSAISVIETDSSNDTNPDSFHRGEDMRWQEPLDRLYHRHIGPSPEETMDMAELIGVASIDELVDMTVPAHLRTQTDIEFPPTLGERALLEEMKRLGDKNQVFRSFLGLGYHDNQLPPVIQRAILENPGWYTQYTPYQAEIAQGRLESLFNFQTMICELTGLGISNASLLDEPTAAAEAMGMCFAHFRKKKTVFLVDENTHTHTLSLLRTRAKPLGIEVRVQPMSDFDLAATDVCGAFVQYPGANGAIADVSPTIARAKEHGVLTVCASDPLALTLLEAPGTLGFDICVGSAQRFGVPMGYGGPHAGFIAATSDWVRKLPGRIVGQTLDADGNPAYRLALQTREQHIRRSKAVSNICTAQALLANVSSMYAVYHGPQGLSEIANRVHHYSSALAGIATAVGHTLESEMFFDTVAIKLNGISADAFVAMAAEHEMNVFKADEHTIRVAFDETVTEADLATLAELLAGTPIDATAASPHNRIETSTHARSTEFLTQEVFNTYHSETEMMRYCKKLENKDISLVHSPIPLGSCTMKLNSAVEMQAVTNPQFGNIHPFAPESQAQGYLEMFDEFKKMVCDIAGYDDMSLHPNSGAQGELAGLMTIRRYHDSRGDTKRNVCLIPVSAHGTNPASAVMAGMVPVDVKVDPDGTINLHDFSTKLEKHKDTLAAMMVTYPSTFGVFEEDISMYCDMVHDNGGQVYLDGANMNAQVGLVRPGHIGADVSHFNLHKTFCIPHGGGGPGQGPIGVKSQLSPFLPEQTRGTADEWDISGAPHGSSLVTTISWAYCRLMGKDGLTDASKFAILNANYMMARLAPHFKIRFTGTNNFCAHEFIIDCNEFKASTGIEAGDIAKRLQDYGLHAPTVSWPLTNALMIEPTESESKPALDMYCDALVSIRNEIREIEQGKAMVGDNVITNAPHPMSRVIADDWHKSYTRTQAAYPLEWLRGKQMWPTVARVNDVYGDKNLVTSIPPRS